MQKRLATKANLQHLRVVLLAAVLLAIAFVIGTTIYVVMKPRWAIQAELARISSAGEPITMEEREAYYRKIDRDAVDNPDWFTTVSQADWDYARKLNEKYEDDVSTAERRDQLDSLLLAEVLTANEYYSDELAGIASGQKQQLLPHLELDANWSYKDRDSIPAFLFEPHCLLSLIACSAAENYDIAAVERSLRLQSFLIKCLEHKPIFPASAVRAILGAELTMSVGQSAHELQKEALLRLLDQMHFHSGQRHFLEYVIAERAGGWSEIRDLQKPNGNPLTANERLSYLMLLGLTIEIARSTHEDEFYRFPELLEKTLSESDVTEYIKKTVVPQIVQSHNNYLRETVSHRLINLYLAALYIEKETGVPVSSIDQLLTVEQVDTIVDPYNGRPMKLIHDEHQLKIYSVGPDGIDDGGTEQIDPAIGKPSDFVIERRKVSMEK
ncbi:hypothetical protein [Calycomorphotria hydatis]|uniref:Uncharacterized protein n=1 Tax=Calycomorphotria hydatis TaxID=2528027 RepID=A0A517TAU6_9PLAN|nr:hypothetical protein [Calycomorphotria hydatis]QDT65496.1 hypothetical protein V22_27500 [Calycomorphotria hydatis]